ncbi:MAG: hypothetical protein JNK05_00900 [Myxococcales bacterium]|nr:hypothetical protein [Myxococcales bacterium]
MVAKRLPPTEQRKRAPLRQPLAVCDVSSTVATIIDRCPFGESSVDQALSLIEEVASAPTFGARWLRKLARDGYAGEITVDVSNVLQLSLARGPIGYSAGPTEEDLRPLQWWAALVRGSVMRMDNGAVFAIEAYPITETTLVGGPGVNAFDALPALDQYGYRLPFAVAVALSAAVEERPNDTVVRVIRARARGGTLDVVELALPVARDGVRDALVALAKSAGTRVALAVPFGEGGGWGYLEAFNDEYPSDNFAPKITLPDP